MYLSFQTVLLCSEQERDKKAKVERERTGPGTAEVERAAQPWLPGQREQRRVLLRANEQMLEASQSGDSAPSFAGPHPLLRGRPQQCFVKGFIEKQRLLIVKKN